MQSEKSSEEETAVPAVCCDNGFLKRVPVSFDSDAGDSRREVPGYRSKVAIYCCGGNIAHGS